MRKITQEAVNALFNMQPFSKSNTVVILSEDETATMMYLHGNFIASYCRVSNTVTLRDAGWQTSTTKERLNGILDNIGESRIFQKDWAWYRGDKLFEGETLQLGN